MDCQCKNSFQLVICLCIYANEIWQNFCDSSNGLVLIVMSRLELLVIILWILLYGAMSQRHKVTHSEISLLINIDVYNRTCQIGVEYKLFLIIQQIIEQHKFTVVYLASFVVINCYMPDVNCQNNTLKLSVMNSSPVIGSVPVLQSRLLNSFFPLVYLKFIFLFGSSSNSNIELAVISNSCIDLISLLGTWFFTIFLKTEVSKFII